MPLRPVMLACSLLTCSIPVISLSAETANTIVSYFPTEPDDALVRRLQPLEPPTLRGLTFQRAPRWLPELEALLIETTVTNLGQQPVPIEAIQLIDWQFDTRSSADDAAYRDLSYRDDTWYGSTYWTGPDWTRVGRDWHHPGENTPSVRRWRAPRDGQVTITGRAYKLHLDGDGVRLSIRFRGSTVWQAEIDGKDAQGVDPQLSLNVRAGESVRFLVHKRGQIFCDTTHWDPLITFADGQALQASASFSTQSQGLGGWFYEMQTDPTTEIGQPQARSLDVDLGLIHHGLLANRDTQLTDRDSLPLLVVADGSDRSGIAMAWNGSGRWRCHACIDSSARLALRLTLEPENANNVLRPGESLRLPHLILAAYRGPWVAGMTALQRCLHSSSQPALQPLHSRLAPRNVELDLWALLQADWSCDDRLDGSDEAYSAAIARHLPLARRLLTDLRAGRPADFLAPETAQLDQLASAMNDPRQSRRRLYQDVRWLKRQIALANPLLQPGKLLFTKRVPTSYSHLVMQYYGWRARPGGGLFVLDRPGQSLACRDILDGKLSDGNVLEPRLSYDARRIVFSYVKAGQSYDPGQLLNDRDDGFYHLFEVNVDGTDMRQLTSGPFDDLMPTYLPDGGIAFCSTRRRGYARCFGAQFSRRWHVYTLHRIEADGSRLRPLSYHDTNEWFPAVSHTGQILYARWDYIDRDAVTHQNLWATRPDGTNPVALWGNATPKPHCTFQIQPIPGSQKLVCTASAHHSIAAGPIVVVDPSVNANGAEALTRITPEIPFPEAESNDIREYYEAPWPLSENYFLVAYSPLPLVWEPGANRENALGIYLLDAFGNRELIYRDLSIGSTNPCPLLARPAPPRLSNTVSNDAPAPAEMIVANVHEGLGPSARGRIRQLRLIQIFPKTSHVANDPPIGLAGEENARAVLGTVPVEEDGSAYFTVPSQTPFLLQALDQEGFAFQTMRSLTYLQPGERVSCIGCHENRMAAPRNQTLAALKRAPSKIDPGDFGARPFSYIEVVQPVLDRHCIRCHGDQKTEKAMDLTSTPLSGFTRSYWALCGDRDFAGPGTNPQNAAEALVPRFGARNQIQMTPPGGMYGALGSRLINLLRKGHQGVQLGDAELRRLALWIDCNAIFYGTSNPSDQARQLRAQSIPMPEIQ